MKALSVRRPWIPSFARRNQGHILIACFPKSGSTYLSLVLQELTGFPDWYGAEPGDQNEQDLSRAGCAARAGDRFCSSI